MCTWREAERVLAGFPDGLVDEGPAAGPASLVGLEIAREQGWTAPRRHARAAGDRADGDARTRRDQADTSRETRRRGGRDTP